MTAGTHHIFQKELQSLKDCSLFKVETEEHPKSGVLKFHFADVPAPYKDKCDSRLDVIEEKADARKVSKAYYQIQNHDELYKLGSNFVEDLTAGQNIFAFTASENLRSVSNVVAGLAAHFEYHLDRKIIILCRSDAIEFYSKLFEGGEKVEVRVFNAKEEFGTEEIILWEVPTGREVLKNIQDYFPAITQIHSCSIVVTKNRSNIRKIKRLQSFYNKYNVKIKGLIFDGAHK